MEKVTVRKLSHDTAGVLAHIERGESVEITKNGRPVARIVPVPADPMADLIARGLVRPARADLAWPPAHVELTVEGEPLQDILQDLREERL